MPALLSLLAWQADHWQCALASVLVDCAAFRAPVSAYSPAKAH
jgi:hypothetical protein